MRTTTLITIIALAVLLMGVTATEGCQTTSAAKTGLDFTLGTGIDKLSSGDVINLGDVFYVNLKIENYEEAAKAGKICVKDNMDDIYEGVFEECVPFSIVAAEVTESEKKSIFGTSSSSVEPGIKEINFPLSGDYKFVNLPSTQKAKLIITAEYSQSSVISAPEGVSVPEPTTERIQLEQDPAPVSINIEKSITKREDSYKVSLGIQLSKQSQAKLYSPDFEEENYIHFIAEMMPQTLECEPEGTYDEDMLGKGLIELKNKKFIRCSTFVYEEEQTWPLQIKLNYGVEIKKEFPFTIKVE